MFLMPTLPFITDTKEILEKTIRDAKEVGVDFIIFGGMTLKDGKQKQYFLNTLQRDYPHLLTEYQMIYKSNAWGAAIHEYYDSLNIMFHTFIQQFKIPTRIPPELYKDYLNENDLVLVILEHLDYLLKLEGKKSPFWYAAYSLSQIQVPLSTMFYQLHTIKGVGKTTEKIIQEILKTGNATFYERLLKGNI
jgi:hypothetical protein